MGDTDQIHPRDYASEGRAQTSAGQRRGWIRNTFRRSFVVTARRVLFALTTGWTKLWRKRPGSKPPHWAKDLSDIVGVVNLVPTFFVMALAPWHFFRRTAQIRRYGSSIYKTPIKFVISAVPFIVGLHWLSVGWLYKYGLVRSLGLGLRASGWGLLHFRCCDRFFLGSIGALLGGQRWVFYHATDVQIVSLVLVGIPIWIPLVSGFVALTLVYPYGLVGAAKSLRSFLIALDPRTYFRIRLKDYAWNTVYFAVYFTIAFPFCLVALYGIYHEYLFPSSRLMHIGLLNLWFSATASAFAARLLVGPYNELLKASVIFPTPLMLRIELSKVAGLLEGASIDLKIAKKGNVAPLERTIDSCHRECGKLRAMNARWMVAAAKTGERCKRKLGRETKEAFSRLRTYELSQGKQFPVSPTCETQLAWVTDFLVSNGASELPEVVPPKKPLLRRVIREALLLVGIAVLISAILLFVIWWFVRK